MRSKTTLRGGDAERMHLKLEVMVETVEYDKVASVLRVRGKNMLESEHVKVWAYHSMEVYQQQPFVLAKVVWSTTAMDYLKQVCDSAATAASRFQSQSADVAKTLADFHAMSLKDSARAFYGPGHVFAAHDHFAIQKLLITDELFKSADYQKRRKYVDLVESVKAGGGEVFIFPVMHTSGKQLQQVTGIAAILRFPLPHLEDMEL